MSEQKSQKSPPPWRVPVAVEDVAAAGQHFDLVADAGIRAAVARIVGLRDLSRLEAKFDVARHGAAGLQVTGCVSATVGQNCVVTLEPLTHDVEEAVNLIFVPQRAPMKEAKKATAEAKVEVKVEAKVEPRDVKSDDPEPLIGGAIDLGALAVEFLMLGVDPYPRKPGAVFEPPLDRQPDAGPFAALAKLTKGGGGP